MASNVHQVKGTKEATAKEAVTDTSYSWFALYLGSLHDGNLVTEI